MPIPAQTALRSQDPRECPAATEACREVLSLPMYPALTDAELDDIVRSVDLFQEE
jgi:dTDP-4-amino-4,6-dideoxygalactose transaminase